MSEPSLFDRLSAIDCRDHIEKKGKFNYLSWTWAWRTLKQHCPEARFQKHTFTDEMGREVPYMTNGEGVSFVKVTVFTNDDTQTELLPILNNGNKPIINPNSFDVNTSMQRCMVKAIAMLGLGLYIYAGEDVPEGAEPLSPYTKKEEDEMVKQYSSSTDLGDIF